MNDRNNELRPRILALLAVLGSIGLIYLYIREFPFFFNTIGIRALLPVSVAVAALLASGLLFLLRKRFSPWNKHLPEIIFIVFPLLFFAPLAGSLLNRSVTEADQRSFRFVSEAPYYASAYGLLRSEKIKPTGFYLSVRDGGKLYRFKYKKQAYFPITARDEQVLIPVRRGLLGFEIVDLK